MEAKDDYINRYCDEIYGFCGDGDRGRGFIDGAKWGMGEIAEWIKTYGQNDLLLGEDGKPIPYYCFDEIALQAQLKRWGIEKK